VALAEPQMADTPREKPAGKPSGGSSDSEPNWGAHLGTGLQMLVGVAIGFVVGNWLDKKYGWSPWGVMAGTMLGLAGGMYLLIKDAIRINKD
jgi:F0F1-type ATP synthase assembly protein I